MTMPNVPLQWLTLPLCIVVVAAIELRGEDDDPSLRRQFLDGIALNARQLQESTFSFQSKNASEITWESVSIAKGVRKEDEQIFDESTTSVRGSMTLQTGVLKGTKKGTESIHYVAGRNEKYAFKVRRSTHAVPYVLDYLEPIEGMTKELRDEVDLKVALARCIPMRTWYFFSEPLDSLIRRPDFTIRNVLRVELDGEHFVRVNFDCSESENKARNFSDAFLILDPSKGWTIKEYGGIQIASQVKHHAIISFGPIVGPIALASSYVHRFSAKSDPESVRCIKSRSEFSGEEEGKEAFYLSHYGLPEPFFKTSWFGVWVWYLLAGTGLIGAGEVLRRSRRTLVASHATSAPALNTVK